MEHWFAQHEATTWLLNSFGRSDAFSRQKVCEETMKPKRLLVIICAVAMMAIMGCGDTSDKNAQLASAVAAGDLPQVKKLLNDGAQIHSTTSGTGFTPLHWAAYEEQIEVAKFLLDQGANPQVRDVHGDTVEDLLKKSASPEAMRLLAYVTNAVSKKGSYLTPQ